MRCPYHGPMTTRSRDRAIPAPPRPFGLRLPLLLLLLVLLSLAACVPTPPPAAPAPPPLVLVSLAGFSADYLHAGLAPTLSTSSRQGVRHQWHTPASQTPPFPPPNHTLTRLPPHHPPP